MRYSKTIQNVNEILRQYRIKLTLRQIYYRLVADYGLVNSKSSYNQLSRQLVKARERGDIDETRIEDRTRETLGGDFGYDDVDDFIEAKLKNLEESWKYFSMPYWKNQDYKLEVWVEKDALSRVISEALIPYGVLTAPSKGYSSYTYVKAGIDRFNKENGKKKIILHFSDHDRLDMTRDLQDRIWRYGGNIEVKRIVLTYDQVKKYDLVPNPIKLADSRSSVYIARYGNKCWELDALPPYELQRIVREAIEKYIDRDRWNERMDEIREETKKARYRIKEIINKIKDNM